MNRRDFSKVCASAFTVSLAMDRLGWAAATRELKQPLAGSGAYIRREGPDWVIGTSKVEQRISLRNGRLVLVSLRNKLSGRDYCAGGQKSSPLRFQESGMETGWELAGEHTQHLAQGEMQLDLQLKSGTLEVTKHWVVYPETAIIREWATIENVSASDIPLRNIFFLNTAISLGALPDVELSYMTGGGNYNGSQLLKTEPLKQGYSRAFDSNKGVQAGNYSAHLPLLLLRNQKTRDNLAVGWDYMGHWSLQADAGSADAVTVALQASYNSLLAPGERIETPKAFTAALSGDLDSIGNQILDWQYQYFWELTNPAYFARTRWAVDWPDPWVGDGGTPSADNWGRRLALDLRYVDLMREAGCDILWDDAGWYDRWGSWNGPEWRRTTDYLRKHNMDWVLWEPTFLATPESDVAQKHPDWLISGQSVFEQSIPATREWQKKLLDDEVATWRDFQWRYDIAPAAAADDTKLFAADRQFRKLLEDFKTSHPKSGIDACDGGGRWISYDIARLAESGEYTDGGVGPYSGYYTSLLVPPDKYHNVSDFDHTYYNASSDRTHLCINPTWYRDPGDGEDVESIRKDFEIYHYLVAHGVAGRWSHVFRPHVDGDDPVWYHQRMNRDGSSGIIIAKHAKTGAGYYLVSKPQANTSGDSYEGGPTQMTHVLTTNAARLDTGIYADPADNTHGYYGVSGEIFGPLNFRYQAQGGDQSFITHITKHGISNHVNAQFFGLAFQAGDEPMVISELGQFDPGNNRGVYSLSLLRAADKAVLGSTTLDMSKGAFDELGFKYAKLTEPVRLTPGLDAPVVIYPKGLKPELAYEVQSCHSKLSFRQSGAQLMKNGITLRSVPAGELIFLNLSDRPGAIIGANTGAIVGANQGPDAGKVAVQPPVSVTKRVGTNLGAQGIEVSWTAAPGESWVSYYEILKNGAVVAKSAIGAFFFDHSADARHSIAAAYEVRAIDGDGNRSPTVAAQAVAGDPEIHEALGEFWPTQGRDGWKYEESLDGKTYTELTWQNTGYEGVWAGSGLGRIGRIWTQPSAAMEIARTFVVSQDAVAGVSGQLQKDPSAEALTPVFVRIEHNGQQIWPQSEWAEVPAYGKPAEYKIDSVSVHVNNTLRFVVKRNGEDRIQPVIWNPRIVFEPRNA